jgi:hypothetical protein
MSKKPFVLFLLIITIHLNAQQILLECEAFENTGGWVIDQQFMDEMGSPFLLAHGLGNPVADASNTFKTEKASKYFVWVRTRNWVATWNAPGTPGRFKVSVNGTKLEPEFGTKNGEWFWQNGGIITLKKGQNTITLHDLTGFEGRCDAICFTTENNPPPNELTAMTEWRRKMLGTSTPEVAGEYDLVVVGGGIAGICSALSGARLGLKVALVQDRPVVGGNNSSEVRVWLGGKYNYDPYPRIGDVVAELEQSVMKHYGVENTGKIYEDERKLGLLEAEENITLFMGLRANETSAENNVIQFIIAQDIVNGKRVKIKGKYFADCTGDGCIGFLAGAEFEITENGHMGRCNLWNCTETAEPQPFPKCPWALDLSDKPFPGRGDNPGVYGKLGIGALGSWFWESGFDHDPITKGEYIRDWNFRAMYGAWDCLKNVDSLYPNHKLNWASYISGKRESRRLLGDVLLTKEDLLNSSEFEDGCVPTSWDMDLHYPHKDYNKGFEGDAFISYDEHTKYPRPYWMPYRCLYSRNIHNLFMAGRDVSVTHDALGSARVMRTGGLMGEIVGMAASICKKHDCPPVEVHEKYLNELKTLMEKGVGERHKNALK